MANKKILYIVIAVLALIIAVGGFLFFSNKKSEQKVYTNSIYGYSISIPESWKGKYLVEEKDNVASFLYNSASDTKYKIFSIIAYPKNEWEQISQGPGYHGTEIVSKDNLIFIYTISLDNPYTGNEGNEYQRMAGDVNNIIKTLELAE